MKSKARQTEHPQPFTDEEQEQFIDHSFDHVARVRAAREAAQRRMEEFGDVSEYDVAILLGQLREGSAVPTQSTLEFQSAVGSGVQEKV